MWWKSVGMPSHDKIRCRSRAALSTSFLEARDLDYLMLVLKGNNNVTVSRGSIPSPALLMHFGIMKQPSARSSTNTNACTCGTGSRVSLRAHLHTSWLAFIHPYNRSVTEINRLSPSLSRAHGRQSAAIGAASVSSFNPPHTRRPSAPNSSAEFSIPITLCAAAPELSRALRSHDHLLTPNLALITLREAARWWTIEHALSLCSALLNMALQRAAVQWLQ